MRDSWEMIFSPSLQYYHICILAKRKLITQLLWSKIVWMYLYLRSHRPIFALNLARCSIQKHAPQKCPWIIFQWESVVNLSDRYLCFWLGCRRISLSQIVSIVWHLSFNCIGHFWAMELSFGNKKVADKNARFVVSGKQKQGT